MHIQVLLLVVCAGYQKLDGLQDLDFEDLDKHWQVSTGLHTGPDSAAPCHCKQLPNSYTVPGLSRAGSLSMPPNSMCQELQCSWALFQ